MFIIKQIRSRYRILLIYYTSSTMPNGSVRPKTQVWKLRKWNDRDFSNFFTNFKGPYEPHDSLTNIGLVSQTPSPPNSTLLGPLNLFIRPVIVLLGLPHWLLGLIYQWYHYHSFRTTSPGIGETQCLRKLLDNLIPERRVFKHVVYFNATLKLLEDLGNKLRNESKRKGKNIIDQKTSRH